MPLDPVRTLPCCGVPEIAGGVVFTGWLAVELTMIAVGTLVASVVPSAFRALTRNRIVWSTSLDLSV